MNLHISAYTFILIRSRVWLNDAGIVAHSKTERRLASTGQVAQNHPDYSHIKILKLHEEDYSDRASNEEHLDSPNVGKRERI